MDIKTLIDKFMDGRTSLEEERVLEEYFRKEKNIPEELQPYRKMFAYFEGGMKDDGLLGGEEEEPADPTRLKNLLLMAVATSIDALAVGASFSMMDKTGVLALSMGSLIACAVIAVVTFIICMTGVWIGRRAGDILGRRAEIVGGIVLILIGLKILLEDLLG